MHEENCRQEIRVADRNTVTINRVLNVSSFDEDGILVKTECGNIVVEGEELTIENLEKTAKEILKNGECFRIKDLAVNGNDLISVGVPAGKELGKALEFLLTAVITEQVENQKEALLKLIGK